VTENLRYSFDVFDTVLTRTVLRPKDVFHLTEQRLAACNKELPEWLRNRFWGARVWSEFMARRRSGAEDITLMDIYQSFALDFGLNDSGRKFLMETELVVESEVLVPIDGAAVLLNAARTDRGGLVFISDMYLPSAFIQGVLERLGLFLPGDRLYVSGELGKSKGSGNLFRHVLDELDIKPGQLVHCGDNPVTDCRVPRALGIRWYGEQAYEPQGNEKIRGYVSLFYHLCDLGKARIQVGKLPHV
jgi:predicted HAD superfamily hydrolase